MKKVILGGIAFGTIALLTKKFLDSKAKEECMDTGEYVLTQCLEMFENIESKAQALAKKVDDYLENADFSTLDKIDALLGGKIEKTLLSVGDIIDAGANAFFNPSEKLLYASGVLGETLEKDYNNEEAVRRANEYFQNALTEFNQFTKENPQWNDDEDKADLLNNIENLNHAFDKCESNIDGILDAIAKSKH